MPQKMDLFGGSGLSSNNKPEPTSQRLHSPLSFGEYMNQAIKATVDAFYLAFVGGMVKCYPDKIKNLSAEARETLPRFADMADRLYDSFEHVIEYNDDGDPAHYIFFDGNLSNRDQYFDVLAILQCAGFGTEFPPSLCSYSYPIRDILRDHEYSTVLPMAKELFPNLFWRFSCDWIDDNPEREIFLTPENDDRRFRDPAFKADFERVYNCSSKLIDFLDITASKRENSVRKIQRLFIKRIVEDNDMPEGEYADEGLSGFIVKGHSFVQRTRGPSNLPDNWDGMSW